MVNYSDVRNLLFPEAGQEIRLPVGMKYNGYLEGIRSLSWQWTEMIDGIDVRIHWDGNDVHIIRTDSEDKLFSVVHQYLFEHFGKDEARLLFRSSFGDSDTSLFGTVYAGNSADNVFDPNEYYFDTLAFSLQDVAVNAVFENRAKVADCASIFDVQAAEVKNGTIDEACAFLRQQPDSHLFTGPVKGLICRPEFDLLDAENHRIVVKIKAEDAI